MIYTCYSLGRRVAVFATESDAEAYCREWAIKKGRNEIYYIASEA